MIILGATGSVGQQAADVARMHGVRVDAISARTSVAETEALVREFLPASCAMADENATLVVLGVTKLFKDIDGSSQRTYALAARIGNHHKTLAPRQLGAITLCLRRIRRRNHYEIKHVQPSAFGKNLATPPCSAFPLHLLLFLDGD